MSNIESYLTEDEKDYQRDLLKIANLHKEARSKVIKQALRNLHYAVIVMEHKAIDGETSLL